MWLVGAIFLFTHGLVSAGQTCSGTMATGQTLYCGGSSSCCGSDTQRYCCDEPEGITGGTIVTIVVVSISGCLVAMWLLLHYMRSCCCPGRGSPTPRVVVTQPSVLAESRDGPSVYQISPAPQLPTAPYFGHDPPPQYQPSFEDKQLGGVVKPNYGHG